MYFKIYFLYSFHFDLFLEDSLVGRLQKLILVLYCLFNSLVCYFYFLALFNCSPLEHCHRVFKILIYEAVSPDFVTRVQQELHKFFLPNWQVNQCYFVALVIYGLYFLLFYPVVIPIICNPMNQIGIVFNVILRNNFSFWIIVSTRSCC